MSLVISLRAFERRLRRHEEDYEAAQLAFRYQIHCTWNTVGVKRIIVEERTGGAKSFCPKTMNWVGCIWTTIFPTAAAPLPLVAVAAEASSCVSVTLSTSGSAMRSSAGIIGSSRSLVFLDAVDVRGSFSVAALCPKSTSSQHFSLRMEKNHGQSTMASISFWRFGGLLANATRSSPTSYYRNIISRHLVKYLKTGLSRLILVHFA